MNTPAEHLAGTLLEDDQSPGAPAPDKKALWDKALKSMEELEGLYQKRAELEKEIAFSVRWNRALAHVDKEAKDAQGLILASELGSMDHGLFPQGSAGRKVWRAYAKKYPQAVVGAHLKDGSSVLFHEPIRPRNGLKVMTYEAFAETKAAS